MAGCGQQQPSGLALYGQMWRPQSGGLVNMASYEGHSLEGWYVWPDVWPQPRGLGHARMARWERPHSRGQVRSYI